MLLRRTFLCLSLVTLGFLAVPGQSQNTGWWKNAVFYQIYPRSFQDSGDDGIGDLKGITSRLDHFKDAGIKAVWLSPIYKSPQADAGYDISDYRDIHHEYGNMTDFEELLKEAHKRGVKVIMDFVPNHSSDEHEWFGKSERNESGYEDYYVWANPNMTTGGVPSNWLSIFRGSTWTWSDVRGQYYLHQFSEKQPELNFRSEKVRQEMKDILKFWLDKGVDGFRIDAVPFLIEDDRYLDEPLSGNTQDDQDYGYLNHIYTFDQPGTFDVVYEWRDYIDQYNLEHGGDERVLLTEGYTNIENTMLYYGKADGSRLGAHVSFNFFFITDLWRTPDAKKSVEVVQKWLKFMPSIYTANWVLGNHDNYRLATRMRPENVDGYNMLVGMLPGVQVTYQGEEIGMENGEVTLEQCQDKTACYNQTIFENHSRDFERTPFHWDNTTNAGFSKANKTWLPVSKKYLQTNLLYQKSANVRSHYNVYKELIKLREDDVLKSGELEITTMSDTVIALTRKLSETKQYVYAFNINDQPKTVNLTKQFNLQTKNARVLLTDIKSKRKVSDTISIDQLVLEPNECVIAKALPFAVNKDWWKTAVFYQIYPRSFKDDDNNGVGDLKGITSKLDHFKESGVKAVWLSPIYKSPQKDAGYDISDYRDINPEYGTLEDFDKLLEEAHKRGVKIIMDFVPNHSSDQHEWFAKSENREEGYENYYVWADKNQTTGQEPNNWRSIFRGSAWTWSDKREQYYFHQFMKEQPDLNFREPKVNQEMKDILKFWLDRGVDGFRVDAVPFIFEDDRLLDEPLSGATNDSDDFGYLQHIYTYDHDETFALIYDWRKFVDEYSEENGGDARVLLTESYTDYNKTMLYYGTEDGSKLGAHISFNFFLITELRQNLTAGNVVNVIKTWMDKMPTIYTANWVLGNHDQYRVATRLGKGNVDGFNMLVALLPGVAVTYQGEEIGMENGEVKFEECQDKTACYNETIFEMMSRDFQRTPYHWDNTTNAGFNAGQKPWLPVSKKYTTNNLYYQKAPNTKSHYQLYKRLIQLRKQDVLKKGSFRIVAVDDVIILERALENSNELMLFLFNLANDTKTVNLTKEINVNFDHAQVLLTNIDSKRTYGDLIEFSEVALEPHESVLARTVTYSKDWWKNAVVYQIYPRSYKDDNNDGIGDLKGITSKLDHIKDAGIRAIWLSPINKSPQMDQGYDISDYRDIHEEYGTLSDFDEMVKQCKNRGIKIILDFVPNHSSDQHDWFKKSETKEAPYTDYYVWADNNTNTGGVPNNWISRFGGSAWTWSEKRQQFYLHQFKKEQPDFNYRSEKLRQEMKDIIKFWLDRGVDGFRVDAVPFFFEDARLLDEPESGTTSDPDDWFHLNHTYTHDQEETFELIYEWREFVDNYTRDNGGDARILLTEAYTDVNHTMYYYGNPDGTKIGAHVSFNFYLISDLKKTPDAKKTVEVINKWIKNMPEPYTANWVLGNHDNHRVATRLKPENADGYNMLIAALPGVMVSFNGEEIAMENGEVKFEECQDKMACGNETIFELEGRDFERTPFHWDNTINAGFNNGTKTWLPVSQKYLQTNLLLQQPQTSDSHYNVYKKMVKLRDEDTLKYGDLKVNTYSDSVLGLSRSLKGKNQYLLAFNIGDQDKKANVTDLVSGKSVVVRVGSVNSRFKIGGSYCVDSLELKAHESIFGVITDDPCIKGHGSAGSLRATFGTIIILTLITLLR